MNDKYKRKQEELSEQKQRLISSIKNYSGENIHESLSINKSSYDELLEIPRWKVKKERKNVIKNITTTSFCILIIAGVTAGSSIGCYKFIKYLDYQPNSNTSPIIEVSKEQKCIPYKEYVTISNDEKTIDFLFIETPWEKDTSDNKNYKKSEYIISKETNINFDELCENIDNITQETYKQILEDNSAILVNVETSEKIPEQPNKLQTNVIFTEKVVLPRNKFKLKKFSSPNSFQKAVDGILTAGGGTIGFLLSLIAAGYIYSMNDNYIYEDIRDYKNAKQKLKEKKFKRR